MRKVDTDLIKSCKFEFTTFEFNFYYSDKFMNSMRRYFLFLGNNLSICYYFWVMENILRLYEEIANKNKISGLD